MMNMMNTTGSMNLGWPLFWLHTHFIFGAVAIAKSKVESVEEIRERLKQALGHIDEHRLVAAPDCGLGLLGRERAMEKLRNLSEAAKSI